MPNYTIYIRKENEERWDSIKDKSAWVNEQLEEPLDPKKNFTTNKDGTISPREPGQFKFTREPLQNTETPKNKYVPSDQEITPPEEAA